MTNEKNPLHSSSLKVTKISIAINLFWSPFDIVVQRQRTTFLSPFDGLESTISTSHWMATKKFDCQGIWVVGLGLVPKSCIQWRSKQAWARSWGFGHEWAHYKTHTFVISCIFFLMCEDFIFFEQSMPYTWKKVGVLWRALKSTTLIVKTIMCWTSRLNLLEDPHTNYTWLYIYFSSKLNLNLPHL